MPRSGRVDPVNFYRLDGRKMPWGDYGRILLSGMSTHLPRKDGVIQFERTAPFVPPISFPGIGDIVITNAFRAELEASGLVGFTFAPVIKARIVDSNWETWDRAAPKPAAYPPGGEPENYILASPHELELADRIGALWELVPGIGGTVERRKTGEGPRDVDVILTPSGASDVFRAEGVRYNFATQRAMEWLVARAGEWVEGLPARVERGTTSDDELIGALRERASIAPRQVVGAFDTPRTFPAVHPDAVAGAESRLGFRMPSLLRRVYVEVADGGLGPGYGLFPLNEHTSTAGHAETLVEVHEKLSVDPRWSTRLLPLCDWGCANWSCLDCRTDDGAIVTVAGEQDFTNTGHTLRSWLGAWLDGVELWNTMFEAGPKRMGINPFTKQPIELKSQGKPRGTPWP
jgi:hypothetical protein